MKVWITRVKGRASYTDSTEFWAQKPTVDGGFYYPNIGDDIFPDMLTEDFKSLFGFTPRKGSCKLYNLKLEEVTK